MLTAPAKILSSNSGVETFFTQLKGIQLLGSNSILNSGHIYQVIFTIRLVLSKVIFLKKVDNFSQDPGFESQNGNFFLLI